MIDARWHKSDATVHQPSITLPDYEQVDATGKRGVAVCVDGKVIGIVVIADRTCRVNTRPLNRQWQRFNQPGKPLPQ